MGNSAAKTNRAMLTILGCAGLHPYDAQIFSDHLRLWFLAIGLLGCATNPVTGRSELNIISESWELKTGKQHYHQCAKAKAATMWRT